jgi:citrate synthase
MKIIKTLEERIEDEIQDIKTYAKLAAEIKDEHPALSHALYAISTQEDNHQAMLHEQVVKLIEQYRRDHGDPPAAMMAVYDILHKRAIEKLAEARRYQEIYKET